MLLVVVSLRAAGPRIEGLLFPELARKQAVEARSQSPLSEGELRSAVDSVVVAWGGAPSLDGAIALPRGRTPRELEAALRELPALAGLQVYVQARDPLLAVLRVYDGGAAMLRADVRPWLAERPLPAAAGTVALAFVVVVPERSADRAAEVLGWKSPLTVALLPFDPEAPRIAREATRRHKDVLTRLDPTATDWSAQVTALPESGGVLVIDELPVGAERSIGAALLATGRVLLDARPAGARPLRWPDGLRQRRVVRLDEEGGAAFARNLARLDGAAVLRVDLAAAPVLEEFVVTAREDGYAFRFATELAGSAAAAPQVGGEVHEGP